MNHHMICIGWQPGCTHVSRIRLVNMNYAASIELFLLKFEIFVLMPCSSVIPAIRERIIDKFYA